MATFAMYSRPSADQVSCEDVVWKRWVIRLPLRSCFQVKHVLELENLWERPRPRTPMGELTRG
ncbi:hypothetical protein PAXRUDRAFT_825469 [Paxillus rubicundulus Ve08.2h10]|uniref:Uncharacterized protein n=1 Tax=Paxillus rubicundulus Ve08.2h10 TaxID=930991 RepID=A0A0D0DGB9_9AGAM|nr:hypothetical protein PAXRUDRAFT_825469 [Paxillus rubicundulus Ve08.2h10]